MDEAFKLVIDAEKYLKDIYLKQEEIEFINSRKVLDAFKINNVTEDKDIKPITPVVEEKVVPITVEQPVNSVTEEVKPITPVTEEKVVPIIPVQPINNLEKVEIKPITPIVEEKNVPITVEQPVNSVTEEVKSITPVNEEKVIPTKVEQPTPLINVTPVVDPTQKIETPTSPSPVVSGNTVSEVKPITPITSNSDSDGTSQPVNFTPINVTNIQ